MKKRILAIYLCAALVLGALGMPVFAAPPTPDNGDIAAIDANSITVEWDPVQGADGYHVYYWRSSPVGQERKQQVLGESSTQTKVSGLEAGKGYIFQVTAYDRTGESPRSPMIFGNTQFPTIGDVISYTYPRDNATVVHAANEPIISFAGSVKDLHTDRIQVTANGTTLDGVLPEVDPVNRSLVVLKHSGFPANTRITVSLQAGAVELINGLSSPAYSFSFTTGEVEAFYMWTTPEDSNSIRLEWDDLPGATRYQIYQSDAEYGTYRRIGTLNPVTLNSGTLDYLATGLSPNTKYWFKVEAATPRGAITSTAEYAITWPNDEIAGTDPEPGDKVTGELPDELVVSFSKDIDTIVNPNGIQVLANGAALPNITLRINPVYRSFNNELFIGYEDLPLNTLITVQLAAGTVRFEDGTTNSAYEFSFTSGNIPAKGLSILYAYGSDNSIEIMWRPVSDATAYKLYYATAEEGPYVLAKTVSAKSNIDIITGLNPGAVYWLKVEAVTPNGNILSAPYRWMTQVSELVEFMWPLPGMTNISPTETVGLRFVDNFTTVDKAAITFRSADGTDVPFTLERDLYKWVLELVHGPLAYDTTYTITFPANSIVLNPYEHWDQPTYPGERNKTPITWSFTTAKDPDSVIVYPENPLYTGILPSDTSPTTRSRGSSSGGGTFTPPSERKTPEKVTDGVRWDGTRLVIDREPLSPLGVTGVYMDGSPVDREDWSVTSGSVVITLKRSYLQSLSRGRHTMKVTFVGGQYVEHEIEIGGDRSSDRNREESTPDTQMPQNINQNPGTGR